MIFSIDFDGTIVENAFPAVGRIKPDTVSFINRLPLQGHIWILNTMREGVKLEEALDCLARNDITPDYVNDNVTALVEQFGNNPRKIFADVYIDDHNAGGLRLPWELLK